MYGMCYNKEFLVDFIISFTNQNSWIYKYQITFLC